MDKLKNNYSQWKGFEFNPEGCLLEQIIDLDSSMGIAYERSCGFYKDFHFHDRLMLVLPRGSCSMEIRTLNPKKSYQLDSSSVFLLPAGLKHDDEGISSIYDTFALYPSVELIKQVVNEIRLNSAELSELNNQCLQACKSQWLDQLIQKYFFNRVMARKISDENTKFFEVQILTEVLQLVFKKGEPKSLNSLPSSVEDSTTKALNFIEANIFENMTIDEIAKQTGVSTSTLLRKFKKEVNQTPYSYIKNRRLDEAMQLLKMDSQPIGQVALLVGYENFGAFSEAFKTKFGQSPSSIRSK